MITVVDYIAFFFLFLFFFVCVGNGARNGQLLDAVTLFLLVSTVSLRLSISPPSKRRKASTSLKKNGRKTKKGKGRDLVYYDKQDKQELIVIEPLDREE